MKELNEAIKWMIEPEKNVYLVSRTSLRDDSKKPCEEAYKVLVKNIDRRRDREWSEAWIVKVDDIYNFICEHGECVLSIKREGFMEIEIYDDYRE